MTTVVVMAGGRGLRLHPLTETCPKPLLRVGSKPILQQIIDRFAEQGFRRFVLSLGYLGHLIEDYFEDGKAFGVDISYVRESTPLGTGGALSLIPHGALSDPFFVVNGDVLADVDYRDMLACHAYEGAQATVALALHHQQIHYGVARIEDGRLLRLDEKPIERFLVNAGIYVIGFPALDRMKEGAFDMPDFITSLDRVATYPIEGYWSDVGTFESLAAAGQR